MKKTILFFFILSLCLILAGCGREANYTDFTGYLASNGTPAPVQTPSAAQPEQTVPSYTVPESSGSLDFSSVVTIVSTPTPAVATPVPTAAPTAAPTPVPTAAPTPIPTQDPYLVRITKSPTSETVQAGGSAVFIAYAENQTGIVWITVSPDTKTSFNIVDAPYYFSGLGVSGQGTSTLTLSNIPYEMNGWRIQAYFTGNGGPLYTAGAYLTVVRQGGSTAPVTGSVESYVVALAKQAYSDIYYYAAADGYSVGSLSDYSYSGAVAGFSVTAVNASWKVVGEFRAFYYSNTSYGYGPVRVTVYDSFGNQWRSENLTDRNMAYFNSILDSYK